MSKEEDRIKDGFKRRQLYKDYHQQRDFQDGAANSVYDDVIFQTQQKWPFLLWLYLKSLGLYHEGILTSSKLISSFKLISSTFFYRQPC